MPAFRSVLVIAFSLCLLDAGLSVAQEPTLYQSAPDEWRAEVIAFPLEFAPDINLTGVDELRFAPGMFDAESGIYFTYTFIWWLGGKALFDSNRLGTYLTRYFKGLYDAVSEQHQSVDQFSAVFTSDEHTVDSYSGRVSWIDPFVTEKEVVLHVTADYWFCEGQQRTAVFFRLSPQPYGHKVWQAMKKQRAGECEEAAL